MVTELRKPYALRIPLTNLKFVEHKTIVMKKALMFSLFAALCCSSGCLSAQTMTTRQTRFEGQNITGVAAGTAFQVEIYQSDKTSATVELPAKWADKLEFTIDNDGVVNIKLEGFKLNLNKEDEFKATVYLKDPYSLKASSSATITAKTPIKTATLNIDVSSSGEVIIPDLTATNRVVINGSSSGEIEAKITAPLLRCDVNSSASADLEHIGTEAVLNAASSADIDIKGSTNKVTATTNSAGKIDGEEYTAKEASCRANSAGKITLHITGSLSAKASTGGSVIYSGDPNVQSLDTSTGGRVRKAE